MSAADMWVYGFVIFLKSTFKHNQNDAAALSTVSPNTGPPGPDFCCWSVNYASSRSTQSCSGKGMRITFLFCVTSEFPFLVFSLTLTPTLILTLTLTLTNPNPNPNPNPNSNPNPNPNSNPNVDILLKFIILWMSACMLTFKYWWLLDGTKEVVWALQYGSSERGRSYQRGFAVSTDKGNGRNYRLF